MSPAPAVTMISFPKQLPNGISKQNEAAFLLFGGKAVFCFSAKESKKAPLIFYRAARYLNTLPVAF